MLDSGRRTQGGQIDDFRNEFRETRKAVIAALPDRNAGPAVSLYRRTIVQDVITRFEKDPESLRFFYRRDAQAPEFQNVCLRESKGFPCVEVLVGANPRFEEICSMTGWVDQNRFKIELFSKIGRVIAAKRAPNNQWRGRAFINGL